MPYYRYESRFLRFARRGLPNVALVRQGAKANLCKVSPKSFCLLELSYLARDDFHMVIRVSCEQASGLSLTALSSCSGCGAKLAAVDVLPLIHELPVGDDERLLVGYASGDDAAVFRLNEQFVLVQTVDFFTPLVNAPYDFGRIAAANALSDVYAMGGVPLTALNIVAFPLQQLGSDALREVLHGGSDVVRAAGAVVVGGHSIKDAEPKFGLAVTGLIDPAVMTTNSGGHEGDVLVLTKPLGVGAIVTAHKRGQASDELLERAVATMAALNDEASRAAVAIGVHAMTDVSGFGLLGHLHILCRESGVAAELDAASVPVLDGVRELLVVGDGISSGSRRNEEWVADFTDVDVGVEPWRAQLLVDATTSGGLLAAVSGDRHEELPGVAIGRLCAGVPGAIKVR
jgi:selenide, water dikinase